MPRIAVSSCILGNNVRYDGQNTLDTWIAKKLPLHFQLKAICPEVAMGMPVPREPVNIVLGTDGVRRMLGQKTKIDHTESAISTAKKLINEDLKDVCGVILQKKSPSCGVERVKLYNANYEAMITEKSSPRHRGLFATEVINQRPLLPVIDSGRMFDSKERENFLRRCMAFYRFYQLDGSIRALQDFHARYKFVIMEHHQDNMRKLGKIAGNSHKLANDKVYEEYAELLFNTLKIIPSSKNQANVFYHLIGFFKNNLQSTEKKVIHQMIGDFYSGNLSYMVPLKMIEYLMLKEAQYYLKNHYYFDQFPIVFRES